MLKEIITKTTGKPEKAKRPIEGKNHYQQHEKNNQCSRKKQNNILVSAMVKLVAKIGPSMLTLLKHIQGDPKKTEPNSNYSKYTGSVFFGSPCTTHVFKK